MPIASNEVVFLESERMSDAVDGGGEMTARQVQSGESGNVWPDISRLDRTTGAVEFRKLFMAIRAANAEAYSGANVIIDAPPADPRVNMFLMSLGSHYDTRQDARNAVESFVVKAGKSSIELNGVHLQGQTDLQCWAPMGAEPPKLGDTLVLIADGDESTEQFVQVKTMTVTTKNFTYYVNNGYSTFTAQNILIRLTSPLERDFTAGTAAPVVNNETKIIRTQPANGVNYYGTRPLEVAASSAATSIKVDQIFQQLLPVATIENPFLDLPVTNGQRVQTSPNAKAVVFDVDITAGDGAVLLPTPAAPGSISLTISGATYREEGGVLVKDSGTERFNDAPAVDLLTGRIQYDSKGAYSGSVSYIPVTVDNTPVYTETEDVTNLSRGINWTFTLKPAPAPGSVALHYRYGDDWVSVRDDGNGKLVGTGSGSVNYDTGTVLLTCEALPELGSMVLVSWSEISAETAAAFSNINGEIYLALGKDIDRGPVTINWTAGGQAKTLSRNDGEYNFTGDGSARVVLAESGSDVYISPDVLADDGSYTINYNAYAEAPTVENITIPQVNIDRTSFTFSSAAPTFAGDTIRFKFRICNHITNEYRYQNGNTRVSKNVNYDTLYLFARNGNLYRSSYSDADVVGTFNESNGQAVIDLTQLQTKYTYKIHKEINKSVASGHKLPSTKWVVESSLTTPNNWQFPAQHVECKRRLTGEVVTPHSDAIAGSMTVPLYSEPTQPGTVFFKIGSEVYFEDKQGRVFNQYNTTTGAGVSVGSIVRDNGETWAELDAPLAGSLNVESLAGLQDSGEPVQPQRRAYYYLPAGDIRPGSLQIKYTDPMGDLVILKANEDGTLFQFSRDASGNTLDPDKLPDQPFYGDTFGRSWARIGQPTIDSGERGFIDFDSGQIYVDFGDWVSTTLVTVNAIQAASVPLGDSVIGVDSVRLPSNGMVPVFKSGDVLVVHSTKETNLDTPAAGQVFDTATTDLASVFILDSSGKELDPAQYTADLAAGTVTMADPLTLQDGDAQALTAPFTLYSRIEEMTLCNDTSLDGTLNLALPLVRDFPAGSMVSSAALAGDVQARVTGLFSQKTDVSGQFPSDLTAD
ncbi:MAG: hypothetical protein CMB99_16425, partial [Flavobacteriaceae bacterium]|nr:hypothetical protein [Flavobacteriaceae bacterium]